ncbi:hypothetical protein FLCH110379_13610 [Flavobacterium chungbukense]
MLKFSEVFEKKKKAQMSPTLRFFLRFVTIKSQSQRYLGIVLVLFENILRNEGK